MATKEESIISSTPFQSELDVVIHAWGKKFECNSLKEEDFRKYWAHHVPRLFSPPADCNCLNITHNEDEVNSVLFASMERFISNNNDPKKVFEDIKKMESPPSLCGKVFKLGEPTYSCRDCGLDPTCVLCVDCFKNSAHKNHKYKMSMSGGGGYCDCGDTEAWKSDAYCNIHCVGHLQNPMSVSPIDMLTPELVSRVQLVMQAVLAYCHQILTWIKSTELPSDLIDREAAEDQDTYATMLFNDETHTYEQVIQTLGRAIECSEKDAIDYATTIDREGRSLVKCSTFLTCNQVKHVIERITSRHGSKPLKVLVMHSSVVAHQAFAMRLLGWLQQVLTQCQAFQLIFSSVLMEPFGDDDFPLLRSIMRSDTQLWKTARNQWHQLFISGMLMDPQCKKAFAKMFTRDYPDLMKDFIADDHEHSVSVTSLSVQLFTVPTLAHALIIEENVIAVLLRTFLSECEKNRNHDEKLAFERNQNNSAFRRAQYVLYDLKYLLSVKPEEWNERLRKNFLFGLNSLVTLLSWMQGMDSVVRQVGQHVEFEAEWETGINIQLKVAPVISLVLEWCASDREVTIKALRKALKALESIQGKMSVVGREIADHSASCIDYDVSSMPVSIHLPLSRYIAGLLLNLAKFDLTYDSHEFQIKNKPTPEQLMELPLRTQVMVAQFRAGMWRRNGYSLLNQIYFYHNVRLRNETYDRDILMLQIAASLIESNEFVIHLLNKYSLLIWAGESYDTTNRRTEDDVTRQTVTIAEEFLGLLLTLVSERYYPGVGELTDAERIKKEIIQLLCIEPLPHSQLVKQLPKDLNYETGMEEVINEVATFKKGPSSGKYELKPEYYKGFNPFFYHYTREDQSKAEEVQLKRRKQAGEEACCPPPIPPDFTKPFAMVVNMLQCDVLLHLMNLVLQRTSNLSCVSFSETQFEKVLHLIGVALHEEQKLVERHVTDAFFSYTSVAVKKGILASLEKCVNCPRIEGQKDLLSWVLKKFKHLQKLQQTGEASTPMDVDDATTEALESAKKDRLRNAELAAARKARIMAQMSAVQKSFLKNFMKEHSEIFKEGDAGNSTSASSAPADAGKDSMSQDNTATESPKVYTCILCREDEELSLTGKTLVLSAFVQKSTVLSKNRSHQLEDAENFDPLPMPADLFFGPHTSTCGHVMHGKCWQKFFESVVSKERRRPLRYGRHISFNVDKLEFLCPLCECLSNTVIPILPPISSLIPESSFQKVNVPLDDWLTGLCNAVAKVQVHRLKNPSADDSSEKFLYQYKPTSLSEVADGLSPESREQFKAMFNLYKEPLSDTASAGANFSPTLVEMLNLFSQAVYTTGLDVNPQSDNERIPIMMWWSCAYTIHCTEWLLRDQGKPLLGDLSSRKLYCLEALVRTAAASLKVYNNSVIRSHCVRLLRYLLLPDNYVCASQCCLEVDAFNLLVCLCLMMPSLFVPEDENSVHMPFPLGNQLDSYIFQLVFYFHLVQVVVSVKVSESSESSMDVDEKDHVVSEGNDAVLAHFCREILVATGLTQNQVTRGFIQNVRNRLVPFLRCSAIFFHFLTGNSSTPDDLRYPGGDTFEVLCNYLGLPDKMSELFASSSLRHLTLSWARHPRVMHLLSSGGENVVQYPLSVNQLITLPYDFSELINNVSLFTCPKSEGDDSRSPTMCLVCGKILCSQSYCCQTELEGNRVGACTYHAHFCGSGIGIYLRIRDCKVLLLVGKTKGCYIPSPYVDEYGETDPGLNRGNPLHLSQECYQQLHKLWLSHGIPEKVAHMLEQSTSLSSTNWYLL